MSESEPLISNSRLRHERESFQNSSTHPDAAAAANKLNDNNTVIATPESLPWVEFFFLGYMACSGAISCIVSFAISELASNCGNDATGLGIVFFSEAMGSILGAMLSIVSFQRFPGNAVLIVCGVLMGAVLMSLSFITNSSLLNVAYFVVGALLLMIQVGCIHLVRALQRAGAGHWIALTQASVSAGASLFLFLDWRLDASLFWDFTCVAIFLWATSLFFIFVPFSVVPTDHRTDKPTERFYNTTSLDARLGNAEQSEEIEKQNMPLKPPHYYAELVVGTAAFLLNGVNLCVTSYLSSYAEETGIESSDTAEQQIIVFWFVITIGRLIGTIDQFCYITDNNILPRATFWMLSAVGAAFIWLMLWKYEFGAWLGLVLLGFFIGPGISYIFDWNHRITLPSEESTTIIMLQTFVGGHTIVYICAAIWDAGVGPRTLIITIIAAVCFSIPFMWWGRNVSYLPNINYRASPIYTGLLPDNVPEHH